MHIARKSILYIVLIIAVTVNSSWAQLLSGRGDREHPKRMFGRSLFSYDTYYFKSKQANNQTRVEVFIGFANDILQFIKDRQGDFSAKYEILVSIFDKKGNLVEEKSVLNEVTVKDFYLTNDRRMTNRYQFSFDVIPGKYKLIMNLTDFDTRKSLRREKDIEIESFNLNETMLSEIAFAEKITFDKKGELKEFLPTLNRKFINPDSSFWAYFEIYPNSLKDSLHLNTLIIDEGGKVVSRQRSTMYPDNDIIGYFLDLSKYVKLSGGYDLILRLKQNEYQSNRKTKFSVIWKNSQISKINIKTAIKTLKDFIPSKDYKSLMEKPDSAKRVYFENFWEERDPTPNTEKNELLEEFYERVDFANNYFSVHALELEGWETDRGKIYIKYGPPEDVERHMEEINLPPYEIWYYPDLQRRFIFEDKSGMGDFRLVRIE